MLKEFREFAIKGNVVDMAVGIVIGGAFGTIVKSFVSDILMPPIGLLMGGVDFADLFVVLKTGDPVGPYATILDAQTAGAVTLNWGLFINNVVSFLIIALAVFFLIRGMNRLKKKEDPLPADPTTKVCEYCRTVVPIQASRCPACTSQLTGEAVPA